MIADSSFIFKSIEEGEVEQLFGSKTLDFAFYEVSNIIWKQHTLLEQIEQEEQEELLELLDMIEKEIEIWKADRQETMEIAGEKEIAFYDASFIYLARMHGEKLATLDEELREKCSKVETESGDF
ncbi:MAG: type II toxin-antitoxin system VapC family toxin [Candidatus Nanohaloarchaea archaeon]